MSVAGPAGVRRDPQSGALEIDGKSSLGAVGCAVAIAGLAVADQLVSLDQPGKGEIVPFHPERGDVQSDFAEGRGAGGSSIVEAVARLFPRSLVRTVVRPHQSLVIHLGVIVLLAADQRQVLAGRRRVEPVAVDGDVPSGHQERVRPVRQLFARRLVVESLLDIFARSVATRSGLAAPLADGPEFLRTEGARDPGAGSAHAGQGPLLESLATATRRSARLPNRSFPVVEGAAVTHLARLEIRRPLRRIAAKRDGFGIDPFVGVDPMASDSAVLDSGSAWMRTIRPVLRLPRIRTGGLVAGAPGARPRRGRAAVLANAHPTLQFPAVDLSVLVAFAACLGTLLGRERERKDRNNYRCTQKTQNLYNKNRNRR